MKYGGGEDLILSGDALTTGEQASSDVDDTLDSLSDLTPLSSEDEGGDNDEDSGELDLVKIKLSLQTLQAQVASTTSGPDLTVQEPDFVRPGVETRNLEGSNSSYERTGVTHLVHAWHPKGHQKSTVSSIYLMGDRWLI